MANELPAKIRVGDFVRVYTVPRKLTRYYRVTWVGVVTFIGRQIPGNTEGGFMIDSTEVTKITRVTEEDCIVAALKK